MDGRRDCQEQGKIDATGTGQKLGETDAEIWFSILHRWHNHWPLLLPLEIIDGGS